MGEKKTYCTPPISTAGSSFGTTTTDQLSTREFLLGQDPHGRLPASITGLIPPFALACEDLKQYSIITSTPVGLFGC